MDLVREKEIEARVSANQEKPANQPYIIPLPPLLFRNFSVVLGESNNANLLLQVIETNNTRNCVCATATTQSASQK